MQRYFIGWDVGAWHCDNNSNSRDALVILDENGLYQGEAWRCNLSHTIWESDDLKAFLDKVFDHCKVKRNPKTEIIIAIDAPLGFSKEFAELIANDKALSLATIGDSQEKLKNYYTNPYLFRETERLLSSKTKVKGPQENEKVFKPLSPVQHMIGSQASKAMHFLKKFEFKNPERGLYEKQEDNCKVIEAYPATLKDFYIGDKKAFDLDFEDEVISIPKSLIRISESKDSQERTLTKASQDKVDAFLCAVTAQKYQEKHPLLFAPDKEKVSNDDSRKSEGWIWTLLKDVYN